MTAEKLTPTNAITSNQEEAKFKHPKDSPVDEIEYIFPEDEYLWHQTIQAINDYPNILTESINPQRREERSKDQDRKFTFGNMNAKREDFGPGNAGELAFQTIKTGAECVMYVDDDNNICGELGIGTVDVDSSTSMDLFPYCSEEHAIILTEQLTTGIKNDGRDTVPARNGFGRGLAIFEAQEK